jgi:hypothetical protein|tara:strand:+ start:595 stop:975 length:381 start_codon:yes stop_codon:yes gene_type:complete
MRSVDMSAAEREVLFECLTDKERHTESWCGALTDLQWWRVVETELDPACMTDDRTYAGWSLRGKILLSLAGDNLSGYLNDPFWQERASQALAEDKIIDFLHARLAAVYGSAQSYKARIVGWEVNNG